MHPRFFGKSEGENKLAWKLEALNLSFLYELEEEWPRMEIAMPHLRLLKVDTCPKLKLLPCAVDKYGRGIWRR